MGLFDRISMAIQEGKAKAELEAAEFAEKIEHVDLRYACNIAVHELKHASLPMKSSITRLLRKKTADVDSTYQLYPAFEEMYRLAQRKRDMFALNISQWIGKKLYDMGDYRVETRESDTKTMYIPRNYF